MNNRITKQELEFVVGMMNSAEKEHPKAKVVFDIERQEVLITYPLPQDFKAITGGIINNGKIKSSPKKLTAAEIL
jgi:hypothetical protein